VVIKPPRLMAKKRKRKEKGYTPGTAASIDDEEGSPAVSLSNGQEREGSEWKAFLLPHLGTIDTAGHKQLKTLCKKARVSAAGGADTLRDRLRSFADGSAPAWWIAEKTKAAKDEEDRQRLQRHFDKDHTCSLQIGMYVEWKSIEPYGKRRSTEEVLDSEGCIKYTKRSYGGRCFNGPPGYTISRFEAVKKGIAKIETSHWHEACSKDKRTRSGLFFCTKQRFPIVPLQKLCSQTTRTVTLHQMPSAET